MRRSLILLAGTALTLMLGQISPIAAVARGGFGGRSFGGGGGFHYHGGMDGGMRSDAFRDFDRGFDHPDAGFDRGMDHADYGYDRGSGRMDDGSLFDHPSSFMSSHDFDSMNRGESSWNGVKNYSPQRSLASDGAFNNVMRANNGVLRGNKTWRATPGELANQARGVRGNFTNWGLFHGNWWNNHPYAWHRGWWNDYWPWRWTGWGAWAPYWGVGVGALPVYYDYGDNITYDDSGYVEYGGQQVCTASDYYQQASDLAGAGQSDFGDSAGTEDMPLPPASGSPASAPAQSKLRAEAGSDEWKPFGIYFLVQGSQTSSSTMFQLASNKKGLIRGNYYNALTDEVQPLQGSIDKKRMRAAWTVGKDTKVVYDTGVANLLKDQSPILIHFGKDSTQQWTLVRMKNPDEESASKSKS